MFRVKPTNSKSILLYVLVSIFIFSCAARIYGPKKGVTEKFFRQSNGEVFEVNDYNFGRLDGNKGLLVFSYEILGGWEEFTDEPARITEKGIRVWEHRFSAKDRDKIYVTDTIMVWGRPSALSFGMSRYGYAIITESRFHKGRIVYGGRLLIDMATFDQEGPLVKFHYNEDFVPWLEEYGSVVKGIGIDTILIHAEVYR